MKNIGNKLMAIGITFVFLMVGFSGCNEKQSINLIGSWSNDNVILEFRENGEIVMATGDTLIDGTYSFDDQLIRFNFDHEFDFLGYTYESTDMIVKYSIAENGTLIIIPTVENGKSSYWTRV